MHLEETDINDKYYHNILEYIRKYFPSFESEFDTNDVYPIMFELGEYIVHNFNEHSVLQNAADLVNELLENGTSYTEDLVVLQIFQLMYEKKRNFSLFENLLSDKANTIYVKFFHEWIKSK